jgi:hypothetical protein
MAMPDQGRRRVVGVALGVAVLVAAGLAVPVARGLLEDRPVAPAAPGKTGGGGPWERLPRPPASGVLQGPDPAAAVWTGEELILLGSSAFSPPDALRPPEALAYDPAANRWRQLAPSPLSRRTWTIQAWTGRQLLVVGGQCGDNVHNLCPDGAAYDPAADTWTPVPGLAGGAAWPEAAGAWTGSELLVWSTTITSDLRSVANTASAYNPGSGRWRRLPPAPIAPRQLAGLVWAGDRLLVWGGLRNLRGNRLAYPDDGAAYDPRGNRWQRLARAPVPGRASPLTVWTGDRAIFVGGMNIGDRVRMDRGNIPAITEQGAAYRPR